MHILPSRRFDRIHRALIILTAGRLERMRRVLMPLTVEMIARINRVLISLALERLERVYRAHRVLTAWISKKCMIGRIGYLFLKLIQVVGEVCVLSDY